MAEVTPIRSGARIPRAKIWKVAKATLPIWIYCNPLKSPKTAKTFFGKAWRWNRIYLEMLGKSLEGDGPGRSARRRDRQHPQRATGAAHDLQRRRDQHRPGRRQRIQVDETLQAVAAGAVQQRVSGIRWRKMMRLPGVGADGLGAEAENAAHLDQKADRGGGWPGRMRAVVAKIGVVGRGPLRPVGAHQRPGARRDLPVRALKGLDIRDLQQIVRVRGGCGRAVDHAGGGDEIFRIDRIDRACGKIAAGDPMRRGIKMGAGMLAHRNVVPVPGRPAMVVVRDFLDPERLRLAEFWRQHDGRKIRVEGLSEIDDPQSPLGDRGREGHELGHSVSCRSRRGSSAHLAWISLAISPTTTSSRPSRSAATTAAASAAGATLGGLIVCRHSSSIGPVRTSTTFRPLGRSCARKPCERLRNAAWVAA